MKAIKILRADEWWGYKIPMLLAVFIYFYDTNSGAPFNLLLGAGILMWWIFSVAAFGYLINNLFDIEQDKLAGKPNFTADLSSPLRIFLITLLAVAALGTWIFFYPSPSLFLLTLLHLCLFGIYSIPPVRLKERGYMGIVTDAIYAYVLPVLVSLSFSEIFNCKREISLNLLVITALIWSLTAGIRSILLHHFKDRKADKRSQTFNVVNAYGIKINIILINLFILPLEILCFYVVLFQHPLYPISRAIIFSFYLLLITFTMTRRGWVWNLKRRIISMRFSPTHFYEGWFLLVNLTILSLHDQVYLFFIPLQIILFQNEVFQLLKKFSIKLYALLKGFYYVLKRAFKPTIVNTWHHFIRPIISFMVNYTIFYFRRIVLRRSESEAKTPIRGWRSPRNKKGIDIGPDPTEKKQNVRNASAVWKPQNFLSNENKVVNGLWIGPLLSNIELLTIRSFLAAGHIFRIWIYEPVSNIPEGVEVFDANSIIPSDQIFRYKYANAFGHGKGSVSGFSDIFRYKLLYDQGGWWVDMDICCIAPFEFDAPYFFRTHHDLNMVGNIMKCPKGCKLMWECYTEAKEKVDENNTDWHKPIEILNRHVAEQGLSDYIFKNFSNEDKWQDIRRYIFGDREIPRAYVALHWMNEEWRSRGINKNDIRYNSTLGKLMLKYDIIKRPESELELWLNDIRHLFWIPLYDRLRG